VFAFFISGNFMRFFPDQEIWPVNLGFVGDTRDSVSAPANEDASPEGNKGPARSAGFRPTPSC